MKIERAFILDDPAPKPPEGMVVVGVVSWSNMHGHEIRRTDFYYAASVDSAETLIKAIN